MSRTGKKPIAPVSGVTVTISGRTVTAKGPKGEQSLTLMDIVNAKQTADGIVIEPTNDSREARAAWGTTRALIANMVALRSRTIASIASTVSPAKDSTSGFFASTGSQRLPISVSRSFDASRSCATMSSIVISTSPNSPRAGPDG